MSDQSKSGDYDWLYADQAPPPDGAGGSLPPPQLPPPGGGGDKPKRRRGKFKKFLLVLIALFVAWCLFMILVPLWGWNSITKVDATPDGDRPSEHAGTTYLLVGSDSRDDSNTEGTRADTIMLMYVGSGATTLISIPRDSMLEIPGHGRNKVNAAYAYGGPKLLVQTLEQATDVRIDNYIEVTFGSFATMVDALGGVQICPETDMTDPRAQLDIEAGCQEVDGATALGYARTRAFATGDIQRVQNQREVLGAIGSKARSTGTFLNPVRYLGVSRAASDVLVVGDNVGPIGAARFMLNLASTVDGNGLTCTVPLANMSVEWDQARAGEFFSLIRQDRTQDLGDLCTDDGFPG